LGSAGVRQGTTQMRRTGAQFGEISRVDGTRRWVDVDRCRTQSVGLSAGWRRWQENKVEVEGRDWAVEMKAAETIEGGKQVRLKHGVPV
jgi:hypothetical protein